MAFKPGAERPFSDVKRLGVAVKKAGRYDYHAGILYRESDNAPAMYLDLPKEGKVRNRVGQSLTSWWDDCVLDDDNARLVAGQCHRIAGRIGTDKVRYGIRYEGRKTYWDSSGKFVADGDEDGLTCATFVLSIFASLGLLVLDESTWKSRDEDETWQSKQLARMGDWGVPRERIAAQIPFAGRVARIRPTEAVTAAAAFVGRTFSFEEVAPMGAALDAQMPLPEDQR